VHGSGALIRWLLENDLVDEITLRVLKPTYTLVAVALHRLLPMQSARNPCRARCRRKTSE
jgi:hypothetical protein